MALRGACKPDVGLPASPGFPKLRAIGVVMNENQFLVGDEWSRSAGVLAGLGLDAISRVHSTFDPRHSSVSLWPISFPRAAARKTLPPKFLNRSNSVKFW